MRRMISLALTALALTVSLQPEVDLSAAVRPSGPALVAVQNLPSDLANRLDVAGKLGDEILVVLHPGDAQRLAAVGATYRVVEADLQGSAEAAAEPDPTIESGRDRYRRLSDYNAELRELARRFPGHVRLVEGREESLEGRKVLGVEIAARVREKDGRPTSFHTGLHHAREWPAAEIPMELARELAENFGTDPRITSLLERVRVLVVPVINPDGFFHSRENVADDTVQYAMGVGSMWRKNMRGTEHDPRAHRSENTYGVDINRNYAYRWGLPTASTGLRSSPVPWDETYWGLAPFSEPETRNIRHWTLSRHATTVLTNHTFDNSILWPWGHSPFPSSDVAVLEDLGHRMANTNGYEAKQSVGLYPTSGTMDDWTYGTTGALSFTFEHLCCAFHPRYGEVREAYEQNREAMLLLAEASADPALHSVVAGRVTDEQGNGVQATLLIVKRMETPSSTPSLHGLSVTDTLVTTIQTAPDGSFEWHVNPSERPEFPGETYELTVQAPGFQQTWLSVHAERGERVELPITLSTR